MPMENLGRPPLPPNRPYHQPLNYLEYVKEFDLDVHVRVYKVAITANGEQKMQNLIICSILPSKIMCFIGVTITHIVFL
jgi:hypothetical protein